MSSSDAISFSVFKRKCGRIYYGQFKLPDGSWTSAKSTHSTSKERAKQWCLAYMKTGQIIARKNITLAEFSKNFFTWNAPWASNKRITGKRISPHHCADCAALLNNHILPRLGNMKLTQITEKI